MNPIRDLTLEANELMDKADKLGEEMTDLEITKLCAEAMGLEVPSWSVKATVLTVYDSAGVLSRYDPLHDDTQAMALVKEFGLTILPNDDDSWWVGLSLYSPDTESADADTLNRAIGLCIAKIEKSKHG